MSSSRSEAHRLGIVGSVVVGAGSALGASAHASTFGVSSSVLVFHPPVNCASTSSGSPIANFSGECGSSGDTTSILGSAGAFLHVYIEATNYSCGCCSWPYHPRGFSSFSVNDLVISATGQTGTVALQFTVTLQGGWDGAVSCSDCVQNGWTPDEPSLAQMQVATGIGNPPAFVSLAPSGGSGSAVWTGTRQIGATGPNWDAELFVSPDLSHGRPCQSSSAWAEALVSFGPLNPDGSIGPIFTFPDCPTCTANAPSIGLVNNYFLAPPSLCPGDVNGDGLTNVLDFNILAGNFGSSVPPNTQGDLNGDGTVSAPDFNVLAGDFGCGT